jgi:transposase
MSYPNDVTDAEWEEIKDFFTPEHPGRPPKHDRRAMPRDSWTGTTRPA